MVDADLTPRDCEGDRASRLRGPVTIAELTAGLIWPTLLRAPMLALYPPRLFMGLLTVAAVALLAMAYDWALGLFDVAPLAQPLLAEITLSLSGFAQAAIAGQFTEAFVALGHAAFGAIAFASSERPVALAGMLVVLTPVWMVGGGAICRMVAVDIAGRMNMTAADALAFAVRNAASLAGAVLIPLVTIGAGALLLKVAGWMLLSVAVIDVLGGLLYGLMILLALGLTVLAIGFALGQPLLAPAVMVEGSDAMDAVQRAYAYVFGRPGRAALYLTGALAQGVVVFVIAHWLVATTLGAAAGLSTSWLSGARTAALRGASDAQPVGGWLMMEWESLFWALLAGFVVSLYFAAATIVYMLLRRVNDEQDLREIWI